METYRQSRFAEEAFSERSAKSATNARLSALRPIQLIVHNMQSREHGSSPQMYKSKGCWLGAAGFKRADKDMIEPCKLVHIGHTGS